MFLVRMELIGKEDFTLYFYGRNKISEIIDTLKDKIAIVNSEVEEINCEILFLKEREIKECFFDSFKVDDFCFSKIAFFIKECFANKNLRRQ